MAREVLAYDPLRPPSGATEQAVQWVDLATVFAESEIVSLHCPAPADGRPMIGARELNSFRRGAVLVNTARAALVEEASLLIALQSGQVDVYATDVYMQEPPRDLALFRHERVIAVSHIGGYTRESVERATTAAVANLLEALARAS